MAEEERVHEEERGGFNPRCPRCTAYEWRNMGTAEIPVRLRGEPSTIEVIVMVCRSCGFVAQHDPRYSG